jgi:hypothetical protein
MADYNSAFTGAQIDENITKAATAVQPGALATVATTGAYSDLTGKPTLGTAAATAAADYATAAQGTLADSATQPGDDAADLGSGAATDGYVLTADGAGGAAWEAASGGGGTPGGSDTQVQFNDGGAFGGDSGFTFDKTNNTLGLGGGTITASDPIIDMAQTWNNGAVAFTAIKASVTDTASAAASLLLDLQVGGASAFSIDKAARASFGLASFRLGGLDVAGATATITASASTDLITWSSHGLVTGSPVRFSNSGGALPSAIVATTTYYAVVNDANSFKIATTYNNATAATPTTVNILTDGTGTNTARAAQVLQSVFVQNFTGTDALGAPLLFNGSQGTGSGPGGSIIFRTASAGTTGSSANRLTDLMVLNAPERCLDIYGGNSGDSTPGLRIFNSSGGQAFYVSTNGVMSATQITTAYLTANTSFNLGVTAANGGLAWSETVIARDAAHALGQRNGVNAQTSRIYGTYTDASNYRRLTKTMSTGGVAEIKPEGAGTGASGNVLHISGLPTSNPGPGILWNNAGTPAIGT